MAHQGLASSSGHRAPQACLVQGTPGVMANSIDPEITAHVADLAGVARQASRRLSLLSRADKDAALRAMADALDAASDEIIAANDKDITRGHAKGLAAGLLD